MVGGDCGGDCLSNKLNCLIKMKERESERRIELNFNKDQYTPRQKEILQNFADTIMLKSAIYARDSNIMQKKPGEWVSKKEELLLVNKKLEKLFDDSCDEGLLAEIIEIQKMHDKILLESGINPFRRITLTIK